MKGIYESLHEYIGWSLTICLAAAAVLLSRDRLVNLFSTDPVHGALSCALLALSIAWYFLYLHYAGVELELLNDEFNLDFRPLGSIVPIVVGGSLIFGGLMAFTMDIVIYSRIGIFMTFVDALAVNTVQINLAKLWRSGQIKLHHETNAGILLDYYFGHLNETRRTAELLAFCGALVLAVVGKWAGNRALNYSAYALTIFSFVVAEGTLFRWRQRRERALRRAALRQVERDRALNQP